MPNVSDYSNENDFMGACVPKMMDEGRDKDQSVAACMSMWKEKKTIGGMSLEDAVKHFIAHEAESELKIGARNNRHDAERLQQIHDYSVENGAICKSGKALTPDEILVHDGGEIKAMPGGKVAGYLIRFSTKADPDLTGDHFTPDTDFGKHSHTPVFYQHGLDAKMKQREIGEGSLRRDEVGVWIDAQLNMRDEYEKAIYEMAKAGKLGWSSGTASHLVDREDGKIKRWPLGLDASLTPTPAEPRNAVIPLKSLIPSEAAMPDKGVKKPEPVEAPKPAIKEPEMELNEIKALFDDSMKSFTASIEEKAAAAAKAAVNELLPEIKAATNVQVVKDEADQPWKSMGEFFMAVKNAAYAPERIDPRLKSLRTSADELKATGMNEAIPSQGGFLVTPQYAPGIMEKVFNTGTLLSLFPRDPVAGNGMTYNKVDETSRADGSRHGGVQGYWGAEAGTKSASKGKFSQLELKLRKVYAMCVATDELLEDANALGSWISRVAPDEIRFKVEDAIINGAGGWQPLGILSSGALVTVTRNDASEIDPDDIGTMWSYRYAGVNDYVWLCNQSIFPQLLQLSIGQQPVFLPAGGLSGLPYAQLLGRPLYEVEYLPALGTLGDLMLVAPSQYQMIEKAGGIQSASSIHVYFTSDETAFRFVYRVDGQPSWSSTLTGKDGVARSPFVVLSASS